MKGRRAIAAIPFDVSLRDALGERLRVLPDDCARYAIAGTIPKSVALPRDRRDAATALAAASGEGAIVAIRGAGTKSDRPPAPRALDVVLDTRSLAGVVEHAAQDLTVTAGAGTTLAQLEAALAGAGQFWPVDAPFHERATIGGTIAANTNGSLRLRYGPLRELVLGAAVVGPDGIERRFGSRVAKSVAGYDIHKLMAGSYGTLGLIAEVTLKVAPLPATERVAIASFASATPACAAARAIAGSNLFPMAIVLHDEAAARKAGAFLTHARAHAWTLAVRCGGDRKTAMRQAGDAARICRAGGAGDADVLDADAAHRAWLDVRESMGGTHYPASRFASVKIVTLPTEMADAIADVRAAWSDAEVSASPALGVLHVHVPVPDAAREVGGASALFDRCRRSGWSAQMLAAPAHACAVGVASVPAGPVRLLRAIKAAFDPEGTLDPGRLPGGV